MREGRSSVWLSHLFISSISMQFEFKIWSYLGSSYRDKFPDCDSLVVFYVENAYHSCSFSVSQVSWYPAGIDPKPDRFSLSTSFWTTSISCKSFRSRWPSEVPQVDSLRFWRLVVKLHPFDQTTRFITKLGFEPRHNLLYASIIPNKTVRNHTYHKVLVLADAVRDLSGWLEALSELLFFVRCL